MTVWNSRRALTKTSLYSSIVVWRISRFPRTPSHINCIRCSVSRRKCGLLSERSKPIALNPSTRPTPRVDGTRYFIRASCFSVTYPRSMILAICSAMVASVPMPFLSINPTRSASVNKLGRLVVPSFKSITFGIKTSPSSKFGNACVAHLSYGYTSK